MATMINTMEALIAYLLTKTSLTARVSTRIYGGGLPDTYTGTDAVLVIGSGGPLHETAPITDEDVQIRCYGRNAVDTRATYLLLADALARVGPVQVTITAGKVVLGRAEQIGGPLDMPEPETKYKFCVSTWHIIWTDRIIST